MTSNKNKPPAHLSAKSKRFFAYVVDEFELDKHHHEVLRLACEAIDRTEEARKLLKREGIVIDDRFGQSKPHPAIAIERDSRLAAVRCLRELGLDFPAEESPKPPAIGGRE